MRPKTMHVVLLTLCLSGAVSPAAEDKPKLAEVRVTVKDVKNESVYFLNDLMPMMSRLGCNTAQCHGSTRGKGGLCLSMFGADAAADFDAFTKHAEGRRVDRREPPKSLVLLKATASIPHGGGKKVEPNSPDCKLLADWVAQGTLWENRQAPKLVAVKARPLDRVLQKGETQPLQLTAEFADGSTRDVTALAAFKSTDARVAAVEPGGKVKAQDCGQAAVVGSFMRYSALTMILVPQPLPVPFPDIQPANKVDELVFADLKRLGIPPSEVCADDVFLRRVYLDAIGALPTPDEVRAFAQDKDPQKRGKLIDRLTQGEEFADCWALKWGDLLRIKSEFPVRVWPKAAQTYYRWVRQAILENKPYDQFVRELLTAGGSNFRHGAVNFLRANPSKDPQTIAESTALIFMGVRLGCARCHGHPTETWSYDDNLGLAAFFGKVAFKPTQEWKEEIVYFNRKAAFRHPRTKEILKPKCFGGEALDLPEQEDPRGKLADWLIRPENPFFVKNIVNRAWSWFLGRGIIHEPDDLRPTNPPSNPELLAFLEKDFVEHKYDLRHLFRLILNSKTYQLSSKTNEWNKDDARHFSHFQLRRLSAEELLDAIGQVTETSEPFSSPIPEPYTRLPTGFRAVQLYDGDISAPFLELFGRPPRDTPYECERNLNTSMRQALHLINSDHLQNRVNSSPRLRRWLEEKKGDEAIVDELYLLALSRPPQPEEKKTLLEFLAQGQKQRNQAVSDAVWAVINTKEFLFSH